MMSEKTGPLIPKRVTIETIFGCNAKCLMCPINSPTKRKKGIMPIGMFEDIIGSLTPYNDHFEMMDLFGLGEPKLITSESLTNCIMWTNF